MSTTPFILFFTGLSNSGKTTLTKLLYNFIRKSNKIKIINIDGDRFRKKIRNFDYDNKSRVLVGNQKIKFATMLRKKGYNVIVSGVAPDKKWRKKNKKIINFFEIYLSCSFKETLKRNKLQTKKAFLNKNQNIIGRNHPYEEGYSKDLTINTSKLNKIESIKKITRFLKKKKLIH